MAEDEAMQLINEVSATIPQERFQHVHKWQVGDILIWDNCAVQHLASFDYEWPQEQRLMWRLTVGGSLTA